jgi:hypothetical protein
MTNGSPRGARARCRMRRSWPGCSAVTGEDQVDARGGGVSAPLRRYDERAQRLPAALAAGPGQDGQDIDVVGAVAASPGEFAGAASPAVGRGQDVMALWRRVNGKPSWAVAPTGDSVAPEVDGQDLDHAVRVAAWSLGGRWVELVVDPSCAGDLVMDGLGWPRDPRTAARWPGLPGRVAHSRY